METIGFLEHSLSKYKDKRSKAERKVLKAIGKLSATKTKIELQREWAKGKLEGWEYTVEVRDNTGAYNKEILQLEKELRLRKEERDDIIETIETIKKLAKANGQ